MSAQHCLIINAKKSKEKTITFCYNLVLINTRAYYTFLKKTEEKFEKTKHRGHRKHGRKSSKKLGPYYTESAFAETEKESFFFNLLQ